jgi:hypothetical protein
VSRSDEDVDRVESTRVDSASVAAATSLVRRGFKPIGMTRVDLAVLEAFAASIVAELGGPPSVAESLSVRTSAGTGRTASSGSRCTRR